MKGLQPEAEPGPLGLLWMRPELRSLKNVRRLAEIPHRNVLTQLGDQNRTTPRTTLSHYSFQIFFLSFLNLLNCDLKSSVTSVLSLPTLTPWFSGEGVTSVSHPGLHPLSSHCPVLGLRVNYLPVQDGASVMGLRAALIHGPAIFSEESFYRCVTAQNNSNRYSQENTWLFRLLGLSKTMRCDFSLTSEP